MRNFLDQSSFTVIVTVVIVKMVAKVVNDSSSVTYRLSVLMSLLHLMYDCLLFVIVVKQLVYCSPGVIG